MFFFSLREMNRECSFCYIRDIDDLFVNTYDRRRSYTNVFCIVMKNVFFRVRFVFFLRRVDVTTCFRHISICCQYFVNIVLNLKQFFHC